MLLASETSIQLTNALEKLIDSGIQLGERVLGALIIFIIGKFLVNWLNRLFARILEKRKVDPSIQSFLKSMVNILLLIMLILAVIGKLGIELTGFAALLASAGVAIGMALSGNLQNFAGGLIILLFRPYKVGDFIEASTGASGTVKEIQIFHTILIPEKDINLTQSLLVGFDNYFKYIHASWLSPIIAIALAFGVLAGVLTWVAGPSKGIFAVGKAGYLPPFFQKTNKIGVQKNILYIQGAAVTLLSLLFVVMPSVQSFYQILSQLTVILYLIMYMLMFSGAIALRYKMKKAGRPFRIGKGGNGLMWLIGGLGFCGSLLAFVLSFIPPSQISTGNNTVWFAVLFIGVIVVVAAPFIIYASKKASWVDPNTEFEPFHWEVKNDVSETNTTKA